MAAGLVAALPIIASGADFDYSHYEAVLKRHIKTGVSINSIRLNAIDYNSIAREAKQPGSDYSILLKELAAFDPGTLKNREEKIAFWGRRGRPCDHASRDRSSCGTLSACLDKPEQTRLARCITSSAVGWSASAFSATISIVAPFLSHANPNCLLQNLDPLLRLGSHSEPLPFTPQNWGKRGRPCDHAL